MSTVFTTGNGALPTTNYGFLAPTVQVTITAGQKIHVVSNKALGSTLAGGGVDLDLAICYQSTVVGSTVTPVGGAILDMRAPQNARLLWDMNADIAGLAAGTYNVALCGKSSGATWNDQEYGYTTAFVHN